jgi:hypothetical protein
MAVSEHLVWIRLCCEDIKTQTSFLDFSRLRGRSGSQTRRPMRETLQGFGFQLYGGGGQQRPFGCSVVLRGRADALGLSMLCGFGRGKMLGVRVKADSTLRTSRAVLHPSTNRALFRSTSEAERDPVHSTRYGHQRTLGSASKNSETQTSFRDFSQL